MDKNEMTLAEATQQYLKALESQGKNPRTLYTYLKDCQQMIAFFGPDKKLTNLLPVHVAQFYKSDELLKIPRNGKVRAPGTIKKTMRVFRRLLQWAQKENYIQSLPLPRKALGSDPSGTKA